MHTAEAEAGGERGMLFELCAYAAAARPLPQELRHGCRDDGMLAPQLRRPILFAAEREEKL